MCDHSNGRYRAVLLLFLTYFFTKSNLESFVVALGALNIGKLDFITNSKITEMLSMKQLQNTLIYVLLVSRFLIMHIRSCHKNNVFTTRRHERQQ